MLSINPSFIDVDFTENSGLIDDPAERMMGSDWPSDVPILSYKELREMKEEHLRLFGTYQVGRLYLKPDNDQTPESSCVYNAGESAFRYCWNRQLGSQFALKWSPMWGYSYNCSSRHSGSTMWGCMEWLTSVGLVPESSSVKSSSPTLDIAHQRAKALCPHTYHQNTPYEGKKVDPEAKATAKHFRVKEWIRIDSELHFANALVNRWPIVYGRQSHSICACDLVFDGREPYAEYLDSYDSTRGDNGRLYDSRRKWNTGGAWACRTTYLPDNPLYPCGEDTLKITRSNYADLYPGVDLNLFLGVV